METLKLANPNRPGHHVTIDLADDDGEPETATCECGHRWHQTDGPTAMEWANSHIPPPCVVAGRIIGRPA